MTATPQLLAVEWPAPARVRAAFSTRRGGLSQGVHASLNLGTPRLNVFPSGESHFREADLVAGSRKTASSEA